MLPNAFEFFSEVGQLQAGVQESCFSRAVSGNSGTNANALTTGRLLQRTDEGDVASPTSIDMLKFDPKKRVGLEFVVI